MGQPQEVEIGGEKLMLHPLDLRSLPLLLGVGSSDPNKQADCLQKIMKKTLKISVPDATEDELNSIALTHFQPLSEAIMKVNGLEDAKAARPSKTPQIANKSE
jgi:hypothetical protein